MPEHTLTYAALRVALDDYERVVATFAGASVSDRREAGMGAHLLNTRQNLASALINAAPALLDVAEAAQRWMTNELDRKRPWTPDAMKLRDALHKLRDLAALEGVK